MRDYNYEALRRDLLYFIERLNFHNDEVAKSLYLDKIERANEEGLIKLAKECNFQLKDYEVDKYAEKNRR